MTALRKNLILVTLAMSVLVSGAVMAVETKPEFVPHQGSNFSTSPAGMGCVGATVSDLQVTLQIQHTWVGDLDATLTSPGGSAFIINQPGRPVLGTFGCSGDDIDVVLSDGGTGSVEDMCDAGVPTIFGNLTPSPGSMAVFNGEALSGDWSLTITDNAGGDTGALLNWCLQADAAGEACCSAPGSLIQDDTTTDTMSLGGDDDDAPAVGTWGIVAMITLLLAVSLFHFRRRAEA